jgi:predicted nucleic acid-binding protein
MTGLVFADANFLLYVRDERAPAKQARAAAWHEYLWRQEVGRTSMQVVSEFYVNLKRMAGRRVAPDEAWTQAARYLAWEPQRIDEQLLHAARRVEQRYLISWWDSMVVAAAQLQDCEILLTEDLQDSAVFGSVAVRSPFTLELRQPVAPYAVAPLAARLHRPRGRPRRTAIA